MLLVQFIVVFFIHLLLYIYPQNKEIPQIYYYFPYNLHKIYQTDAACNQTIIRPNQSYECSGHTRIGSPHGLPVDRGVDMNWRVELQYLIAITSQKYKHSKQKT